MHRRFICIKIRQIPTDNVSALSSADFDPRFGTDKSLRHERRWRISPQKYLSSSITGRIYARPVTVDLPRAVSRSGSALLKKFWDHPVDIHDIHRMNVCSWKLFHHSHEKSGVKYSKLVLINHASLIVSEIPRVGWFSFNPWIHGFSTNESPITNQLYHYTRI